MVNQSIRRCFLQPFLISIIFVVLNSMNINFLSKFQGKTKTVTKLGIQNALKGETDTIVYTNTHKSFGNLPSNRFRVRKDTKEDSIAIQKSFNEETHKNKQALHLPSIDEKYSYHKNNSFDISSRDEMTRFIEKQSNWNIENEAKFTSPRKVLLKSQSTEQKIQEITSRIARTINKMEKKNNLSVKYQRLGGLGANIGGSQWQARHAKQEKSINYAQHLRRIQRQKHSKAQENSTRAKTNLNFAV